MFLFAPRFPIHPPLRLWDVGGTEHLFRTGWISFHMFGLVAPLGHFLLLLPICLSLALGRSVSVLTVLGPCAFSVP